MQHSRKRRPLALLLLLDLLAAGLLTFAVYLLVYHTPTAAAAVPVLESAPAEVSTDWKTQFAAHFTDKTVQTDHSYTSPNLSVDISRHTM